MGRQLWVELWFGTRHAVAVKGLEQGLTAWLGLQKGEANLRYSLAGYEFAPSMPASTDWNGQRVTMTVTGVRSTFASSTWLARKAISKSIEVIE